MTLGGLLDISEQLYDGEPGNDLLRQDITNEARASTERGEAKN